MYLLDTNIVSHLFRENKAVLAKIKSVDRKLIFTASCVFAEAYFGVENCPRLEQKIALTQYYNRLAETIQVINFDLKIAKIFAGVKKILQTKGRTIEDFDLIIAATCLAYDLTLVTNNGRHFEDIEGMQTEDWTVEPAKPKI